MSGGERMVANVVVTTATPEEAGFRSETLRLLDEHLQQLIERRRLQAASYLLARNGRVFAMKAMGKRSFREEDDAPMRTDTIRRIASVTKLFTAAAVFQLVERGRLYLRQAAADWLEEMDHPLYRDIRIWHLLTHTSGVRADPGYFLEPYPFSPREIRFAFEPEAEGGEDGAGREAEHLEKCRRSAWIRAVLAGRPLCKPGRVWNYSTFGYQLLGEIIARASGMPFEDYVLRHIVEPLGMTRTFFRVPDGLMDEVCVVSAEEEGWMRQERSRAHDPPPAGGGLYSTLEDLFRFGQMLLQQGRWGNKRILSRKSVEKMTRDVFAGRDLYGFSWGARNQRTPYGMGASITGGLEWPSPGSFGHEGAGRCKLLIDPDHQAVIVFFVPTSIHWVGESILHTSHLIAAGWL